MFLDWRFSISLRYSFHNGRRRLPPFNALLSLLGLSLGVAILLLSLGPFSWETIVGLIATMLVLILGYILMIHLLTLREL